MKSKGLEVLSLFLIFLFFCFCSFAESIEGRVVLKGSPPTDKVIMMAKTRDCSHGGEIKTEFWKLGTNGGLGDVVVWVKGVTSSVKVVETRKSTMIEQKGCRYIPHVSAVQVKEKVKIKNGDPTLHNVRGNQFAENRKGRVVFNLGQPTQGMVSEVSFLEPGLYSLECDVHPWMQAWVMTLENPFFAVTDSLGYFKLPSGIPAGEYEVQAWHQQFLKPLSQKIKVTDQTNHVNFEFVLETKEATK